MRSSCGVMIYLAFLPARGGKPSSESILPEDPRRNTIQIESPAFADGGNIPKIHTCEGEDSSPPLKWSGVPDTAKSLAIVVEDVDAPRGTWTHWVLFNLPADIRELPQKVPTQERVELDSGGKTTLQGTNDFGKTGYGGPCPPSGTHRYIFRIFAIDHQLGLGPKATRPELLQSLKGHLLAEGKLTGRYSKG